MKSTVVFVLLIQQGLNPGGNKVPDITTQAADFLDES